MQAWVDCDMGKRTLHSLSRLMAGQLKRGRKAEAISPVIAINVLDFNYIRGGIGFHNRYRMKNVLTDVEMPDAEVFEVHFVELRKLPRDAGSCMKELWVKFLSAKSEEDLIMLTTQSPVLKKAVNKLVKFSSSDERRYIEDMIIKDKLRMASFEKGVREEAMKKGMKEGMKEVARAMKADGLDDVFIAKYTGLPVVMVGRM
jgi:predicted transposase/invertase (TIGR01784 family)